MTQISSEYSNNETFQIVLSSLLTVSSRRTSDSFAILALSSILDSLKSTYSFDFLNYVSFSENEVEIDEPVIEDVDAEILVKVFDSIIRVIYTDLDEQAGLFFIKELKEEIGNSLVSLLQEKGLNFDLMALEQRHLQRRRSEKKKQERNSFLIDFSQIPDEKNMKNMLALLSSAEVVSCKIDLEEHSCVFIDKTQTRLGQNSLGFVLRSFVDLVKKHKVKYNRNVFSDKTIFSFLDLLQSNDQVSINHVQDQFGFSTSQVDQLIRYLLRKNYVRYKTISKLEITEKGKGFLEKNQINQH